MACKCKHCYGLREYLIEKGLDHRDLPKAPGHPTFIVRADCTREMTCVCSKCQAVKVRKVKRVKQPWEVA